MGFFSWIGNLFKSEPTPVYDTWPSRIVTYSFKPNFGNRMGGGLSPFAIRQFVHKAAVEWTANTCIELRYVYEDSDTNIIIRDEDLSGSIAGFGEFPATGSKSKGLIFDNSERDWTKYLLYKVALHEFGHCLGLRHCSSSRRIMYKKITRLDRVTIWDAQELDKAYSEV